MMLVINEALEIQKMKDERNGEFKLMITQDKLVDLLMHAATREDIAKLDAKVDARLDKMDTRLDKMDARLDRMEGRLDRMEGRLDRMDLKFDGKFDKIIFGVVLAIVLPICTQIFYHYFSR